MTDTATLKVGDMVKVVGPIDEDWECYVSDLDEMIGLVGTITYITDYSTGVDFGGERWNFPTSSLRHARAETSQPTPTEQLRAIAQAETAFNTCGKMDRMVIHGQLVAAQSNADFPAILAHVEAMEAERDESRKLIRDMYWAADGAEPYVPGNEYAVVRDLRDERDELRRRAITAKAGGK